MSCFIDKALGVILRTPGLFIIDYWWWFQKNKPSEQSSLTTQVLIHFAFINSLVLLVLPQSLLRTFYSHVVYFVIVCTAHLLSYVYFHVGKPTTVSLSDAVSQAVDATDKIVTEVVSDFSSFVQGFLYLILHGILAMVVSFVLQTPHKPVFPLLACYSLPVMAKLVDFPSESVRMVHSFSYAAMGFVLLRFFFTQSIGNFMTAFSSLKGVYRQLINTLTSFRGLIDLILSLTERIFAPSHFLLFWIISFCYNLFKIKYSKDIVPIANDSTCVTFLATSASVCCSPVSLLATTVTVSYASSILLYTFKKFVNSSGPRIIPHDIDIVSPRLPENIGRSSHSGWEEGVMTLLLAILTDITEMTPVARIAVLTIILFVVLASLLQSMLEIAEPVILSLSAYHGQNFFHHLKVLLICAFVFSFPLRLTYVFTQIFLVDFWMAVVLSISILTSAQVVDLVIVHCFLWYDATRNEPWAPLDEVVYYVRGVTKIFEFLVDFSVVVVGLYEGSTGPWNWTNAFILVIHCYFNVCQRFQQGLRSFFARREAVQKSANLPPASSEQLEKHHDVCAICFTETVNTSNSVVTPCTHFFHRVCLRRWLSFQDRCPLCFTAVISEHSSTS